MKTMVKHVKIYMRYFDLGEQDIIYCEICHTKAVDIHHIHGRGKGKDIIKGTHPNNVNISKL